MRYVDGEKEARRRSSGRVGEGQESEGRSHQVGNASGSIVGVLFASLSRPFSVEAGEPDEVGRSVAECLGVVGPVSLSLSLPGSNESWLQLPVLPLPPKV